MRELSRRATSAHCHAQLAGLRTTGNQREPGGRSPGRALHILNQSAKAISLWIAHTNGRIENLFSDFGHTTQQGTASSQHDTTRELSFPAGVLDLIGNVHQNFFGARLQNITEDLSRELTWRAPAHRRNIDSLAA